MLVYLRYLEIDRAGVCVNGAGLPDGWMGRTQGLWGCF
jgi:hypothetical protein